MPRARICSKEALADLITLIHEIGIDTETKLVDRETLFCEPFEIPDYDPHVRLVVEGASRILGRRPEISFHEGQSDSCILANERKVSTIEFGPSGGTLHESEEFVEIDSVKKVSEVYRQILRATLSYSFHPAVRML